MRCIGLTAMAVVLLSGAAAAQSVDSSGIHPVTAPLRDAGTLDLSTGLWRSGSGPALRASTPVFDNTCTWTGGGFYAGPPHCMDIYDDGRIPSTSDPNAPVGATDDNLIDGFRIAYCTGHPTGAVAIAISFWDHNGGPCAGWVAQQAIIPATAYNGATAYFDLSGTGLPGSATAGSLSCWTVTIDLSNTAGGGFCLLSDGDGSYQGTGDEFNWAFQHEMDNSLYGTVSGPLIKAEPLAGAFGACTYNIACGVDPFSGAPCGTGRATSDQMWQNVDGCAVGGAGCSGVPPGSCPNAPGSGCYFFGGWPANAWASFYMQMTSSGACGPGCTTPPVVYCSYTDPNTTTSCGFDQCPSSGGCLAMISTSNMAGCPQQDADDYDCLISGAEIDKNAVIFGGFGRVGFAFSSGSLCVQPPIKRTPVQNTGNQGSVACTGTMSLRLNDPSSTNPILNLAPGTTANYQGWLRDPMGAGTDVSDAIEITFE